MDEGLARSFNNILWKDGTQSSKVFAGIQSIIVDDPTTGVAAGIDRATNTWWRNRALVGTNKVTHSTSDQRSEEHTSELQSLMRNSYAVFCLKKKQYNTNMSYTAQDYSLIIHITISFTSHS